MSPGRNKTKCCPHLVKDEAKRPACYKILEERSEAKGIGPILSKSKIKWIGVFQKFVKTKQNEVKTFKIEQDRSKTNIFFFYCEEEENEKKRSFVFFWKEAKKNEKIVPQLSKICHCYLGAWGTLIHEKNLKSKISCQTPFKGTWPRDGLFFLFKIIP